jgi:hypothetical protein
LPTTNNTTIATFADDTALLATNSDPALATQQLQYHLDLLQEWCDKWKIKINHTKSSQITFKTKRMNCPPVTNTNNSIERSQISGFLPRPKANLAETHQDKTPTPKLKSTTNVLAPRMKIHTFTGKQDSSIQMYPKTDLDIWNSALGMY